MKLALTYGELPQLSACSNQKRAKVAVIARHVKGDRGAGVQRDDVTSLKIKHPARLQRSMVFS